MTALSAWPALAQHVVLGQFNPTMSHGLSDKWALFGAALGAALVTLAFVATVVLTMDTWWHQRPH